MIVPAGHRVLVKIDEAETVTAGGIIVAATIVDKNTEAGIFGTLVAVGDTAWKDFGGRAWACVGDKVVIAKYGGFVIEDPATKDRYRLLNDEDIVAVLR